MRARISVETTALGGGDSDADRTSVATTRACPSNHQAMGLVDGTETGFL